MDKLQQFKEEVTRVLIDVDIEVAAQFLADIRYKIFENAENKHFALSKELAAFEEKIKLAIEIK